MGRPRNVRGRWWPWAPLSARVVEMPARGCTDLVQRMVIGAGHQPGKAGGRTDLFLTTLGGPTFTPVTPSTTTPNPGEISGGSVTVTVAGPKSTGKSRREPLDRREEVFYATQWIASRFWWNLSAGHIASSRQVVQEWPMAAFRCRSTLKRVSSGPETPDDHGSAAGPLDQEGRKATLSQRGRHANGSRCQNRN